MVERYGEGGLLDCEEKPCFYPSIYTNLAHPKSEIGLPRARPYSAEEPPRMSVYFRGLQRILKAEIKNSRVVLIPVSCI